MSAPLRVAAIVPCYNEGPRIGRVLEAMPDAVDVIVAVDDGSIDGTREALSGHSDPRLVVLRHEESRGVGGAVVAGYRKALELEVDVCVKVDGDGQMDPGDIPRLLEPLRRGEAEYVKGNRFFQGRELGLMPTVRLLGNGVLSFLTKLVSGYWSVFDPTNGFTAVRSDVLRSLDLSRLHRGWFFETSMLVELSLIDARIRDVTIPARYGDEESSLRILPVLVRFPPLLLRGLCRRFFWRYMIRDFNAVTVSVLAALPALAFGVVFGGYHWWRSVATGVPATAGTTLLAALPVILGFQCLLTALVLDMLYEPGGGRGSGDAWDRRPPGPPGREAGRG